MATMTFEYELGIDRNNHMVSLRAAEITNNAFESLDSILKLQKQNNAGKTLEFVKSLRKHNMGTRKP